MARPVLAVPNPERSAALTRALTYFVLLGTFAAFAWAYRQGFYEGKGYPNNSFVYAPSDRFRDLASFFPSLLGGDRFHLITAPYPPFSYIMMEPFAQAGYRLSPALWTLLAVGGIGGFILRQLSFLGWVDRLAATAALTVATYPFLFSIDRMNIELVVTLLLAAFAYCLQTRRTIPAALLIGAAAAMKGYPAIFAALFLVRGQWRALAISAVTAIALWLLGTVYFDFHIAHSIDVLRANVKAYNELYVLDNGGLAFNCSLWGPLKLLAWYALGGDKETMRALLPFYQAFSAVLLIGMVLALWRLPFRLWEQLALLTIAFDALPPVSADYKLLHLVVPMALFLCEGGDDRRAWWYVVGFGLLMVPKAYWHVDNYGVNLGVLLDPLIMLAMTITIVAGGIRRRDTADASVPSADYALA